MLKIKISVYEREKSRGKIVIVRGNCKKKIHFYRAVQKQHHRLNTVILFKKIEMNIISSFFCFILKIIPWTLNSFPSRLAKSLQEQLFILSLIPSGAASSHSEYSEYFLTKQRFTFSNWVRKILIPSHGIAIKPNWPVPLSLLLHSQNKNTTLECTWGFVCYCTCFK